jgi:hypothetical protein
MNFRILLWIGVLFFITGCKTIPANRSSKQSALFVLKTGNAEMITDPNFGARIISLKYNNAELLYGGYADHESSGSTLWPAPQSNWQWPPIDTLDYKPYIVREKNKVKTFVSMPSYKTGFQMSKSFKVNTKDSSFTLTYSIKNISGTIKKVGCWEVSRLFPGGVTFFPAAPDSGILARSTLPGVTIENNLIWFKYDFNQIISKTKLYAMGSEGWVAHIKDGIAFIKSFEDLPSSAIAPQQGEIEIYANGNPRYVELENHGKYAILYPEESVTYQVKWYLRTVPENLLNINQQTKLINWVRDIVNPQPAMSF